MSTIHHSLFAVVAARYGGRMDTGTGPAFRTRLAKFAIVVDDYDAAIAWYCGNLGMELLEDFPMGPEKRWVVIGHPGAPTTLLLAKASTDRQRDAIGNQFGGRVGFFLQTSDIDSHRAFLEARGVVFEEAIRFEEYGRVAVFRDLAGNRWDLIEPADNKP